MISAYAVTDGKLRPLDALLAEKERAVWIDLLRPTREEEQAVEAAFGVEAPTREEMQEIEISSRLYVEDDTAYMTAFILSHTDDDDVIIAPITFVLAERKLLTIRYDDPRVFTTFATRSQKAATGCNSAETVLAGLLETIVSRVADILERVALDVDALSHEVFAPASSPAAQSRDFQRVIVELGRKGDLASKIRDSLVSLERLFGFAMLQLDQRADPRFNDKKSDRETRARLRTLFRDAHSLTEHVSYVSQKITFLLDATLGMINIEQNAIIKTFSVVAVAFLPPTLIASIYGMNFKFIPELGWPFGYAFAIVLMILSAILPLFYFKKKGWL